MHMSHMVLEAVCIYSERCNLELENYISPLRHQPLSRECTPPHPHASTRTYLTLHSSLAYCVLVL